MKILKNAKGKWVIDFTCRGRRITRVIGPSKREAEARAEAIRCDIRRDPYNFGRKKLEVLFEDQAKEFMELHSKQNKRSWARDEISLAHLKDFFKGKYLSEISPDLIEKYRLKRKADGISLSTINRELACLKTLFGKAIEWEKCETNPARKVKKFRENGVKERILTIDEMRRLIDAASLAIRPVLVTALNTGMRKNEILSLRWSNVDLLKGYILIEDSKSGRSRKIPMNGQVLEALGGLKQGGEFIFANSGTGTHIKDVKTAFWGACRRAKIKDLRFHDLRHTAATRMIEAGIDLVTVSRILGHASIQMTMRYAHPTPENMRRAVEKLGEVFQNSREKVETIEIRPSVSYLKSFN
ncbi:MAG: tyrosine-type recombinase/integrase [Candidatus Aminicenantales bacterium]